MCVPHAFNYSRIGLQQNIIITTSGIGLSVYPGSSSGDVVRLKWYISLFALGLEAYLEVQYSTRSGHSA